MNKESWQQITSIVDRVLNAESKSERTSIIEKECGDDQQLRIEIESLLNSIEESAGFWDTLLYSNQVLMDNLAKGVANAQHISETAGEKGSKEKSSEFLERVGAYKIKKQIGVGGMGEVFLVDHSDGKIHQNVALKLIRFGIDSNEQVRRFEQEQAILSSLNHPNIARLLDGGVAGDGRPYYVMEYVDGEPITGYCKNKNCNLEMRLSLFTQVCKAVQYAHTNFIVHRDLKPDNLLVNRDGRVKVLDFGIAKLLDAHQLSDQTLFETQAGQRHLSLSYAAPEQLTLEPVTTATDVYVLGLLLFELLTEKRAFNLKGKTFREAEAIVRHEYPKKPSMVAEKWQEKLKGDLDAIIQKALRKEPAERYGSAQELLDDINRYIEGQPIKARPATKRYYLQKFILRNKTASVLTGIMIIIFTGFIYLLIHQRAITMIERDRALTEAQTSEQLTGFLIELFEANDPNISQGDTLTALHLLKRGEERINAFDDQPVIKSRLLEVLGNIYDLLSYPQKGDSLKQVSLALNKDLYGPSDPELASIYYSLAKGNHVLGEYDKTLGLIDTAITYQQHIYGPESSEVAGSLKLQAETLRRNGRLDRAYQIILQSQSIYQSLRDTRSENYLETLMERGSILTEMGNYTESEEVWHSSLALSRTLYHPPHPQIMNNILGLATVYKELEKYSEAENLYTEAIRMTEQLYGKTHINTAVAINNLSGLYYYRKEYEKSDSLYEESYAILKEILGEEHPYTISNLYNWANLKVDMENYQEAEKIYLKVIELDIAQFGENHPNVASDYTGLANLYKNQKKYSQSLTYYNKSLEIRRNVYDNPDHPYIALNERSIAEILTSQKQYREAETLYKSALKSLISVYGKQHLQVIRTSRDYEELLKLQNKPVSQVSIIFNESNR